MRKPRGLLVLTLLVVTTLSVAADGKLQIGALGGIAFPSESDANNRYPFGGQISYFFIPSFETGLYVWTALDSDEAAGIEFTSYDALIAFEANYHLRGLPGPFFRRWHVGVKLGNAIRGINEEGRDSVDANVFAYGAEVGWWLPLVAGLRVGVDATWIHMPETEATIESDGSDITYTFGEISYFSILAGVAIRF